MTNWAPQTDRLQGPLYLAIADQIADAIGRGELTAGTRLPTQRELAVRLGVSTQTVSQAYAEAERRGLVIGQIGRGTFVRFGLNEASEGQFIMDRRTESLIDLSINRPIYDQIHTDRIRTALVEIGERGDVSSMLVCRPIAGLDHHRQAGAQWLRRRQSPHRRGGLHRRARLKLPQTGPKPSVRQRSTADGTTACDPAASSPTGYSTFTVTTSTEPGQRLTMLWTAF